MTWGLGKPLITQGRTNKSILWKEVSLRRLAGPESFAGPVGEHYRFDPRMMEEVREESIEAYALFGLAYFHSECLHRELCHA
jgi:hypothetical protein